MANLKTIYCFIDESGDPTFYAKRKRLLVGTPGFQPYLIIGLVETDNRKNLREVVFRFQQNIKADILFNSIPSIRNRNGWYPHARGDHPEVRAKFFELLRKTSGYAAHVAIAKKNLEIFNKKHNNNPEEFYFDVVQHLLRSVLTDNASNYMVYLSMRGKNNLHRLNNAVQKALESNGTHGKIKYKITVVPGPDMPELSIVDYLLWAIQRNLLKNETRFFDSLKDKYKTIIQLYDGN